MERVEIKVRPVVAAVQFHADVCSNGSTWYWLVLISSGLQTGLSWCCEHYGEDHTKQK